MNDRDIILNFVTSIEKNKSVLDNNKDLLESYNLAKNHLGKCFPSPYSEATLKAMSEALRNPVYLKGKY